MNKKFSFRFEMSVLDTTFALLQLQNFFFLILYWTTAITMRMPGDGKQYILQNKYYKTHYNSLKMFKDRQFSYIRMAFLFVLWEMVGK